MHSACRRHGFWILSLFVRTDCLAVERRSEPTDLRRVDDGQIDSVNFDTICLAVKRRSEPRDCGQVDDGQTNSVK